MFDKLIRWIIIGAVVLAVIVIAYGVVAFLYPDVRVALRDIFIVILAIFQMIATVLVIVLLISVLYAVKAGNDLIQQTITPKIDATVVKIDEVLDNTRTIVGNVRESSDTLTTTTVFTAERVVSPIIRVSGLMAGVRAAATALAHRDNRSDTIAEEKGAGR